MDQAEVFCQRFFKWYNQQHYHSGIAWLTAESVHYGRHESILDARHKLLMKAYQRDPVRFNKKPPQRVELSPAVYINPPKNNLIHCLQREQDMAQLTSHLKQLFVSY